MRIAQVTWSLRPVSAALEQLCPPKSPFFLLQHYINLYNSRRFHPHGKPLSLACINGQTLASWDALSSLVGPGGQPHVHTIKQYPMLQLGLLHHSSSAEMGTTGLSPQGYLNISDTTQHVQLPERRSRI